MKLEMQAFFDELEKIALKLSPDEERQQLGQFAGLGAATMPVIGGLSNMVQKGHPTGGVPLKRWLPAQVLTGALLGGAMPAVRHAMERKNVDNAKARRMVARELLDAKSMGVDVARAAVRPRTGPVENRVPEFAATSSMFGAT